MYLFIWLCICSTPRGSYPSPKSSPRRPTTKYPQKFGGSVSAWFSGFFAAKLRPKSDVEKNSEKRRKSRILASQNWLKIVSKCLPERIPGQRALWHWFFTLFGGFRLRALHLQSAQNLTNTVEFLYYEHNSNVRLSDRRPMKKRLKKLPKTLSKRRPNPSEIDAENKLFFGIDFFGFRPQFWKVLDLQDGAKLALKAKKNYDAPPLERS